MNSQDPFDPFCPQCGHLNENSKDWTNPAFARVYGALAITEAQAPNDDILNWLNHNGFANLTCCPECHFDDFTHVKGCRLAAALDQLAKTMDAISKVMRSLP